MLKSKRSGGPRTAAGKLAASQNALKTGSYAKAVLLPGENQDAFSELLQSLRVDFSPADITEHTLVDQMAALMWKLQRLEHIEQGVMRAKLRAPFSQLEWQQLPGRMDDRWQWIFADFDQASSSLASEANAYIDVSPALHAMPATDYFEAMRRTYPKLLTLLLSMAESYLMLSNVDDPAQALEASADKMVPAMDDGPAAPLYKFLQAGLQQRCLQLCYCKAHLEEIKAALSIIHAQRLMSTLKSQDIHRAHGYLTNALFRVMGELRKQQDWRIRTRTAEVGDAQAPGERGIPQGRLIEQVSEQKPE